MQKSLWIIPVLLLFATIGAPAARADIFDVTINAATYSETCIGGIGTCTEIVNGSFLFNSATNTASNLALTLTGTLNASLDIATPGGFEDSNACFSCVGFTPIGWSPDFPIFPGPVTTPTDIVPGGNHVSPLNITPLCGGDPALATVCGTPGTFPVGIAALISGTYTSVDESFATPEPSTISLMLIGFGSFGLMLAMRKRIAQGHPQAT